MYGGGGGGGSGGSGQSVVVGRDDAILIISGLF